MTETLNTGQIAALCEFDSPTICNAIELFKLRPQTDGYLDQTVRAIYPELPPVAGYARTFEIKTGVPVPGSKSLDFSQLVADAASKAQKPWVAVVHVSDMDQSSAAAYGDVMVSCFRSMGAVGLVTNGFARDIEPVGKMSFPCFATGVCVSHGYASFVSSGNPAQIGGMTLNCGDLLHADANGVTTIPHKIATKLPEAAQRIVDAEMILLDYIRSGDVDPQHLQEKFAAMKAHAKAFRPT